MTPREAIESLKHSSYELCRGFERLAELDGKALALGFEEAEQALLEVLENVRMLRTSLPSDGAL